MCSCLLHAIAAFSPYFFTAQSKNALPTHERKGSSTALYALLTTPTIIEHATPKLPIENDTTHHLTEPIADASVAALSEAYSENKTEFSLPSETHYFTTKELTTKPYPLSEIEFGSTEADAALAVGKLIISLWINELGDVTKTTLEHSELPEVVAKAAIKAFEKTHFKPGELDGQPVATVMKIEVIYPPLFSQLP